MNVGVLDEHRPGERRVALIPAGAGELVKAGWGVTFQRGAGWEAGYPEEDYRRAGAELEDSVTEVLSAADVLLTVRRPEGEVLAGLRPGQTVIGLLDPLGEPEGLKRLIDTGASLWGLELLPRITRAQSMDVLSSMAGLAGYQAVLLGASELPRMMPMLMTPAGTVAPARVLVLGAGVAGLAAIATARRLGAVVRGYDIRPAAAEQVQSLGARFVELELAADGAEDSGGYARAQGEEFLRRQQELLGREVAESDLVITTAAVPGRTAPILVTTQAVRAMAPGSVVVDLAAQRGGNCESTIPDEVVKVQGVTILGPTDLPSQVAYHASQMLSRNILSFLRHLAPEGRLEPDREDEILAGTLVARGGELAQVEGR